MHTKLTVCILRNYVFWQVNCPPFGGAFRLDDNLEFWLSLLFCLVWFPAKQEEENK